MTSISPYNAQATAIGSLMEGAGRELLQEVLPGYLEHQRWFGGKSRKIHTATMGASITLSEEYLLALIDVTYDDKNVERYQLPLALASGDAAQTLKKASPKAVLGTLAGAMLYDATASEGFRQALLSRFNVSTVARDVAASHSPAFDPGELMHTASRVGSAEQSNTSILFGQKAILKLFRRLQSGENPDVEISRFLTDTAHFEYIPAYLGELHQGTDGTTLAFLQAFAPNKGDGWSWFSEALMGFYEAIAKVPQPASTSKTASFLAETKVPGDIQEYAGASLQAAALIGTRTAQMHLALATPTDYMAFAAEITTAEDLARDSERIRAQIEHGLGALQRTLATVPSELAGDAAWLLSQRSELLQRTQALTADAPAAFGRRIRIHGDYHLGQLLRVESGFLIVDFEGEPARPLEERRQKQSPLKDVAGMLRSFSYVSRSTFARYAQDHALQPETLSGWALLWEDAASARFLEAYRNEIQMAGKQGTSLLPDLSQSESLLHLLLLEKSLYELLYELNNRPDWLHIPLRGLSALARMIA